MREEKSDESFKAKEQNPAIDGWRSYYNFIRPLQALDELTPTYKANLNLTSENKRFYLLKNTKNMRLLNVTTEKTLTIY